MRPGIMYFVKSDDLNYERRKAMTPTVKAAWIGAAALVFVALIPSVSGILDEDEDEDGDVVDDSPVRDPFREEFQAPRTTRGKNEVPMGKWDYCAPRQTIVNRNGSYDCAIEEREGRYFLIANVHGTSAEIVCTAICTSR